MAVGSWVRANMIGNHVVSRAATSRVQAGKRERAKPMDDEMMVVEVVGRRIDGFQFREVYNFELIMLSSVFMP